MTQGTEPAAEEAAPSSEPEPGVGPRRRRGRGGWALAVLGVVGELLITLGLVLGLFVTYSLWWTDVLADRSASAASDHLRESWATGAPVSYTHL